MDAPPLEPTEPPVLCAENIAASYDGTLRVLDGLSLAVRRSETVAIMGRSGAGKSTLLRCLAALVPLSTGRLSFGGQTYANETGLVVVPHELRRRMTYVPQEISLLGHYTVRKNLSIVLRNPNPGPPEQLFRGLITSLKIADDPRSILDRFPDELSGGQRQRVQLARAILNDPEMLLLDEVTSQVDAASADAIVETIRQIRNTRPRLSIVVVTHNPHFAASFADRVLHLEHGRLFADGTGFQRERKA